MAANPELNGAVWRKARGSDSANGCLEVAFLAGGRVALRDSEDLDNPPFVVTEHVWRCFIDGAQRGEFDSPGELEDLDSALALARLERDRALGRTMSPVPHDEARRTLLEAAGRGD